MLRYLIAEAQIRTGYIYFIHNLSYMLEISSKSLFRMLSANNEFCFVIVFGFYSNYLSKGSPATQRRRMRRQA